MAAYVFLCDAVTENECLTRSIVGTTQQNALWVLNVQPGDILFLYNFQSGIIHGPLVARSLPDCHEPEAWGGRFPVQLRFDQAKGFRSIRAADISSPSTLKILRRGGLLTARAEKEISH